MSLNRLLLPCLMFALAAVCFARQVPGKIVLGKLGQTLKATNIHSSATTRSRIYYRVKPYEYLVLNTSKSKYWYTVLLQNGTNGYVRTDVVASLPWDVTIDAPKEAPKETRGATDLASRGRAAVANYGLNFQGAPYKWGGNDPVNGIDCSAFVKFLYGQIGVNLPRTAAQQAYVGQPIYRLEDLKSGDRLYFWDSKRGKIGHTGAYLGNGYFVHSSSGRKGVATDYLGATKWRSILVAARR